MCNSACPYLILGAATREIAPDALLAVHSPKVVGTLMPDGKSSLASFDIDTDGLATAWTQLLAPCPAAPPNNGRPAGAFPMSGAVPVR